MGHNFILHRTTHLHILQERSNIFLAHDHIETLNSPAKSPNFNVVEKVLSWTAKVYQEAQLKEKKTKLNDFRSANSTK